MSELQFYTIRQNNPGGEFDIDANVGHFVIVEAKDVHAAEDKLHEFCEYDSCECCGERWYFDLAEKDACTYPHINGKPLDKYRNETWWTQEVRVHYADGRIESFIFEKK